MDLLHDIALGFSAILTPEIIAFAVLGCALGMLTGVLPGFGPPAATALLLPLAFVLDVKASIVMIAAIYYGSMYGGTITSVLLNVPGEVSSVATGIDGYQMTRKGQAGKALAIAAVGSFVGGTLAFIGMLFASNFSELALGLTFIDIFALSLLALMLVIGLAGKSMVKGLAAAALGLLIGTVGLDHFTGRPRFTFGNLDLSGGISYVAVVMGIFGLAEILQILGDKQPPDFSSNIGSLRLSWRDIKDSMGSMGRGTAIGFFFGLVPGSPAAASAFTSYAVEKRFAKHPENFGHGAIQGVAGPETANNALGIANFIPLLTLGIPSSSTMAILLGAFIINGLQPGPLLFADHPDIAWGIVTSLMLSNVILLIMALPLVRMWVQILRVPTPLLYPIVLGIMTVGAFAIQNSVYDVVVMWVAGVVGLLLRKLDVPLPPLALTLVLGPMIEANFRRGLSLGKPFLETFASSAVSIFAFACIALVFVVKGVLAARTVVRGRRRATTDASDTVAESPDRSTP
ncbi:MAG: tripartite tricarboxylate transporter permease [Propionibacteriaceae bacterium]|jgi:putative tricarboxylic transport membrane protein|nr:tripartite tricarboxylate transporter permease [Propionibacteriaceae bacterium]